MKDNVVSLGDSYKESIKTWLDNCWRKQEEERRVWLDLHFWDHFIPECLVHAFGDEVWTLRHQLMKDQHVDHMKNFLDALWKSRPAIEQGRIVGLFESALHMRDLGLPVRRNRKRIVRKGGGS